MWSSAITQAIQQLTMKAAQSAGVFAEQTLGPEFKGPQTQIKNQSVVLFVPVTLAPWKGWKAGGLLGLVSCHPSVQ